MLNPESNNDSGFLFGLKLIAMEEREMKKNKPSPLRAIRLKCLQCSNYQPSEVRFCQCFDCPIFPFRFGRNPNRAGIGGGLPVSAKKSPVEPNKITKKEAINGQD